MSWLFAALCLAAATVPAVAGVASAELSITKADDPDPVVAGSALAYTLVVTNSGPASATAVLVVDELPGEVTFDTVSVEVATGTVATPEQLGQTVTVLLSPLTVGDSATVEIEVTVDALTTETITNVASVEGTELDPVPGNNSVEEMTEVTFPDIAVGPGVLGFGSHRIEDTPTDAMAVTVSNEGTADLGSIVVSIAGENADEFAIDSDTGQTTLGPDETRTVDVVFVPKSAGPKVATLEVESNDPDESPVVVDLSGTGLAPELAVGPLSIEYNARAIDAGASPPREVTVTNGGNDDLTGVAVALGGMDSSEFAIDSDTGQATLGPGESRRLGIVFDPMTLGEKFAAVTVTADLASPAVVELRGTGTSPVLTPEIGVEPTSLDFGETPVNTSFNPNLLFVIANFGGMDLTFTPPGIALSPNASPEFTFVGTPDTSPLPGGEQRSVFVRFDPVSLGPVTAEVTVTTNDADEPAVAVTLTGEGGQPVSGSGLQTKEIVNDILGLIDLNVDVNVDGNEDAADVVTNQVEISGGP